MKVQKKEDWVDTNQGMQIIREHNISCTRTSLLTWVRKYRLGKKVGGRWYVSKERLQIFLEGGIEK